MCVKRRWLSGHGAGAALCAVPRLERPRQPGGPAAQGPGQRRAAGVQPPARRPALSRVLGRPAATHRPRSCAPGLPWECPQPSPQCEGALGPRPQLPLRQQQPGLPCQPRLAAGRRPQPRGWVCRSITCRTLLAGRPGFLMVRCHRGCGGALTPTSPADGPTTGAQPLDASPRCVTYELLVSAATPCNPPQPLAAAAGRPCATSQPVCRRGCSCVTAQPLARPSHTPRCATRGNCTASCTPQPMALALQP